MVYVNVRHTVADYAKWRQGFDGNESFRRTAGATGSKKVYRDQENPNTVTVIMEWNNADQARKFTQDPRLKEVMEQAGVIGAPEIRFLNEA
jgi:quinol monooxygenase YgiN